MTAPTTDLPPPPPPPPAVAQRARPRLGGVDLARAIAVVGMVSVHTALFTQGAVPGPYGWAYGRASTLFALVAGVGIALSGRRRPTSSLRARLLYRSVWLLPLGVLLQRLPNHPVAVILQQYALWFLLTALVVGWSSRALLALVAVGVVVGPTVLVAAQTLVPDLFTGDDGGLVLDVVLTGYYPTVSWWWVVLAGVVVGRLDLGRRAVAGALLAGGAATAALLYAAAPVLRAALPGELLGGLLATGPLLATEGHADTSVETVAATGVAVAVLGGCLLLGSLLPRPVLAPGVALGRTALSFYVGHVVLYSLAPELLRSADLAEAVRTTATAALVGAGLATAWLAVLPRGPLEAAERWGFERLVRPRLRARA